MMEHSSTKISWEDFKVCIDQIKSLSDKLHDGWVLKIQPDGSTEFITKSTHVQSKDEILLTYEYHIVYNISYAVPELCFNIFKSDGSLLKLEEALKYLNFEDVDVFTTITQMDHPILQRPYLTLHPCKTNQLIGMSFKNSKNMVVSWLSAVGPSVNLYLSNEYALLT